LLKVTVTGMSSPAVYAPFGFGDVTFVTVGTTLSNVTVLSVLVEAALPAPSASCAAFTLTLAITVPVLFMPDTATS
jgi:hypothetical protein